MRFYDEFLPGVEWISKYETDSLPCANSHDSLNDWLHWSWAGAMRVVRLYPALALRYRAWGASHRYTGHRKLDDRFSGNGGLSIRRVSAIRKVLGFQARY